MACKIMVCAGQWDGCDGTLCGDVVFVCISPTRKISGAANGIPSSWLRFPRKLGEWSQSGSLRHWSRQEPMRHLLDLAGRSAMPFSGTFSTCKESIMRIHPVWVWPFAFLFLHFTRVERFILKYSPSPRLRNTDNDSMALPLQAAFREAPCRDTGPAVSCDVVKQMERRPVPGLHGLLPTSPTAASLANSFPLTASGRLNIK